MSASLLPLFISCFGEKKPDTCDERFNAAFAKNDMAAKKADIACALVSDNAETQKKAYIVLTQAALSKDKADKGYFSEVYQAQRNEIIADILSSQSESLVILGLQLFFVENDAEALKLYLEDQEDKIYCSSEDDISSAVQKASGSPQCQAESYLAELKK